MGLSTFKGSYQETVSSSATWVISHNLGTDTPCVDVWVDDSGWKKIQPLSIVATDSNTVTITFTTATAGKVIVG